MSNYVSEDYEPVNYVRWDVIITGIVLLIFLGWLGVNSVHNVPADSICVIQSPVTGNLAWYTTPGLKWQGGGKVTTYKKSFQYWFSKLADQGTKADESVETRFNDGGHAKISGSVRIDLPLDPEKLTALHTRYGSQEAIEQELVRPAFERAIYMSGPLMSSAESYSEKRNQLVNDIADQASRGVYRTTTRTTKTKDPITGSEKTISVVDLVMDPKAPGGIERAEVSPIEEFGLKAYNLSINAITYDEAVDKQIQAQQAAIMEVQTAMAEAKKAEQRALTVEQEGRATAAKAKWEQEAKRATAVTEAEQRKDVARLEREAAEYYKAKQILRAEGDADYRKKVMEADGALTQKLATYEKVMDAFAKEFGRQKWVPEIMMGADSGQGGDQVSKMISLLTTKAAQDLGLNLKIQKQESAK